MKPWEAWPTPLIAPRLPQGEPDGHGKVVSTTHRSLLEVDFVANRGYSRLYIQSALHIPDEAKMEQESASLRRIDDSFQKIIIVKDDIAPYQNNDGFLIVGLFDFLLNPSFIPSSFVLLLYRLE